MSQTLEFPFQYAPNPEVFGSIALGKIYVGVVDGDPAFDPSDRIQVYLARQNDTDLAIPQPIDLSSGGVPEYNGAPAVIKVNQQYSISILDRNGNQVFYSPKSSEIIDLNTFLDQIYNYFPVSIPNVAALSSITAVSGRLYRLKEYNAGSGVGGGDLVGKTGSITPNNVTTFAGTVGTYFERINTTVNAPEYGGANVDGSSNDNIGIQRIYGKTKNIIINSNSVNTLDIKDHGNATYRGDGSFVSDPYLKHVIPFNAKSDHLDSVDVIPSKHLRWACSVENLKVCLVGDSISTRAANTYSTGNMLTDVLMHTLRKQFPGTITFLNRAISGMTYGSLASDLSNAAIPWYTSGGISWQQRVANDNPDLVIFSFGMNDSSAIQLTAVKNAIDFFKALPRAPSIIICTPLAPNGVSPGASPDGKAFMEGRQGAAGFLRSYAKWRNNGNDVALLDINRKYNMAQNGFDPLNTVIRQEDSPVAGFDLGGGSVRYQKSQQCSDWQVVPEFDDSNLGFEIIIKTGTDIGDFVQITRNATQLGIAIYSQSQLIFGGFIAYTFSGTTARHFTIEKKGNWLTIKKTNNANYGMYDEYIYSSPIVSNGGVYDVTVTAKGMSTVRLYPSEYVWNEPSVRMDQVWGIDGGSNPYGGSGFNHPGDLVGAYIYRQVIESTRFYEAISAKRFVEGSLAAGSAINIASGTNTIIASITLPPGDWDVSGVVGFLPAATTNMTILTAGVTDAGTAFYTPRGKQVLYNTGVIGAGGEIDLLAPTIRLDLRNATVNTTVNLVCRATFTASTLTAYGYIRASER